MKKCIFKIESNERLTEDIYQMKLSGDTSAITKPGQFVNVELNGLYLRRPISVCNLEGHLLTLVYKVVGSGTAQMSRMLRGEQLDLLTGLGNGYELFNCGEKPIVIGGGVGIPPLYLLTKRLIEYGKIPRVILGYNTKNEVFYENEFKALGCEVFITTADGSLGTHGFVTNAMESLSCYDYTFSCGPEPMLKAIYHMSEKDGQFSFEERMGCGFGACMGCTCKTKNGAKRICTEGPVLKKEEIIW